MRLRFALLMTAALTAAPAFAAITGVVMDRDGKPIAGARITAHSPASPADWKQRLVSETPDPAPLVATQSDAKGAFTFESPKDAYVSVRVTAPGHAPAAMMVERDDDAGVFALRKVEMKSGVVRAGGKPAAGALVVFSSGGGAEHVTRTDEAGRFTVPDPSVWASRVVVIHRGFAIHEEAPRPKFGANLDVNLTTGSTLTGTVVGEDGKSPAAGVALEVDGWPAAMSREDGAFTLTNLPKNWKVLRATTATSVGAWPKDSSKTVRVRLVRPAMFSGVVRDLRNQNPVAGARVTLLPANRMAMLADTEGSAVTDAKGAFAIRAVPGSYELMTSRPGYDIDTVTVSGTSGARTDRFVGARRLARVTGRVAFEDRTAAPAALVGIEEQEEDMMRGRFMSGPGRYTAWSGPDGSFAMYAPGETALKVTGRVKGYPATQTAQIRLSPGERKKDVALTVLSGFEVTGRVTNASGKPVAGVRVVPAQAREGGPGGMVRNIVRIGGNDDAVGEVETDADGNFSIRLTEGKWDFGFARAGFADRNLRSVAVSTRNEPLAVTLEPGHEISGRVTRNGAGVEGLNIMVASNPRAGLTTGPDGYFTIPDLSEGSHSITFMKFEDGVREMRSISAPTRDFVLEIPPGGRVTGRVKDKATGQPITTFQAGTSGSRGGGGMRFVGPPMVRSFTSEDGSFTLEHLGAGQTEIVATAPGYARASTTVTIEDGKTIEDIEISLTLASKIVGKVMGPDGSALSGAVVTTEPPGSGPMRMPVRPQQVVTDGSGQFEIDGLEEGRQSIQATHPKFLATEKTVEVNAREVRVDLRLEQGLRVTGQVVTEAGAPVADASVRANTSAGRGAWRSATTDANGTFTFDALEPGRYIFNARKSGLSDGELRDFDVATGAPRIVLKAGGIVWGRVSGFSASDMQNVSVMVVSPRGNRSTAVDASGNYRLEGAPEGAAQIVATTTNSFASRRSTAAKPIEVRPGEAIQVDLEFRGDTVVRGRVTRNGAVMAGANVAFMARSGGPQNAAETDSNGMYTVSGLEDGSYNVQVVDMQRMTPYITQYEVQGSGTFDIEMRTSIVRGVVIDKSSGQPVIAQVELRPSSSETRGLTLGGRSDSSGKFTIDGVTPGNYVATVRAEGYAAQVRDLVATDGSQEIDFRLERSEGLAIRVTDARDGRGVSAYIQVYDAQDRVTITESLPWDGKEPARIALPPGTHRAAIGANGYATQMVNVVSPGTQAVALTPGGSLEVVSQASTPRFFRILDASGRPHMLTRFTKLPIGPAPAAPFFRNVAPGTYTVQIVDESERVITAKQVTIQEGGAARIEM
jgi:hypothetical protein